MRIRSNMVTKKQSRLYFSAVLVVVVVAAASISCSRRSFRPSENAVYSSFGGDKIVFYGSMATFQGRFG